jgi:transposase InsO family protein
MLKPERVLLPTATIRAVSAVPGFETDPRTVRKYLNGETVAHLARRRIERAMRVLGLPAPFETPIGPHRPKVA